MPCELAGASTLANLWPQGILAAERKDRLEDRLGELVRSGALDLGTAQKAIAENWLEAYAKYFR